MRIKIVAGVLGLCVLSPGAHAASGSAEITLGSERHTVDLFECSGGPGAFSIKGKGTGEGLVGFSASDGEVKTVVFRIGNTYAQVVDEAGRFDGTTFVFDGEAQVYTSSAINRQKLTVRATCAG